MATSGTSAVRVAVDEQEDREPRLFRLPLNRCPLPLQHKAPCGEVSTTSAGPPGFLTAAVELLWLSALLSAARPSTEGKTTVSRSHCVAGS